jgi:hypothetical protein
MPRGGARGANIRRQQTEEQKKKVLEAEKAYKAALGRIPDQKPSDPWASVRK